MKANKIIKGFLLVLLFNYYNFTIFGQCAELHAFNGTNGKQPYASLIFVGGSLYGMTPHGGSLDKGLIFKMETDGSGFNVLYEFNSGDGKGPLGSLLQVGTYLYGTTGSGGVNNCGIVFRIKPDGTSYQKLHDFTSSSDGKMPSYGKLYFDGTFLYGTCIQGGAANAGTIFKLMPDGSNFSVLHNFNGTDGGGPEASLIGDGVYLYGTTEGGGNTPCACGVLFKIKPDGSSYTLLHEFSGGVDGTGVSGELYFDGTYLYGTTMTGGTSDFGTIFKIKSDGTSFTKIFDFDGAGSGGISWGGLISDGIRLYGVTHNGGLNYKGVVFSINPDGANFTVLCQLNETGMGQPQRSLCSDDSFLYGMTDSNGGQGLGSVFSVGMYTGIPEQNKTGSLKIFPNPAKNEIEISEIKNSKNFNITIYDACGNKEMFIEPEFSERLKLDVSKLSSGLHFVQVRSDTQNSIEKLIISDL